MPEAGYLIELNSLRKDRLCGSVLVPKMLVLVMIILVAGHRALLF